MSIALLAAPGKRRASPVKAALRGPSFEGVRIGFEIDFKWIDSKLLAAICPPSRTLEEGLPRHTEPSWYLPPQKGMLGVCGRLNPPLSAFY